MEFPVVVKTCCGGSSVGVYIVNNQKEYEEALDRCIFQYEDDSCCGGIYQRAVSFLLLL